MDINNFEDAIKSLENNLIISITIVDNLGIFQNPLGNAIFTFDRRSHRKNKICAIGFCENCIKHCRYQMNAKSEKLAEPFFETCWKGVTEIVVPLNHNGKHLGMLYAGSWRKKDMAPPRELNKKAAKEFYKLPLFDESKAENISMILYFFTKGMLAEIEQWHIIDIPKYSRMGKIKLFIMNNLDKQIQLSSLSEHLGISKSRTSFLLKRFFNQSFSQLLCEERIRRAKILLLGTDDSVSMIAEQVGINDEYYFNKVFKKIAGIPPGKFRKL